MTNHPVDIYILSGFLGSGKTTLLHRLLQEERRRKRKVAVLMNELGDLAVDSAAVPGDIPLKELLNGCICCTIQGQLTHQLLSLHQQYKPDVIYIESTGVAHPLEVLEACVTPQLIPHIRICKIVTVVDLLRWQHQKSRLSIRLQKLLEEQVRYSDFLILNKMDALSANDRDAIVTELKQLNTKALTVQTNYADFPLQKLYRLEESGASFVRDTSEPTHVHRHLHVRTFSYTWTHPIAQRDLEEWLRQSPDQLYRAKGYIRLREHADSLFSFQYSYGMPLFVPESFPHPTITVFIGEELDADTLKQQLRYLEEIES
jgi:G3E family GTPase